jgi:DNA mismatch repair protein MutL
MVNDIIILPEDLVDKIAAGEVVERPASVVKELVENSIDAGAKNISVEIKMGGIKFIRVTDDGIGMDERNSVLAFQRHATSKIKTVDDLFQIATLGFRGEALPSIASVSFLDMLTRTQEEVSGTRLKIEGGVLKESKPMGAPLGTSVLVRELFYNVPARRKFLKTILTETRHVIDLLTRFAIAYPEISFKLKSDERELFNFTGTSELKQRVTNVFGKDRAEKMIVIKADDEMPDSGISQEISQQINGLNRLIAADNGRRTADISGFLGKPEICPSNRAELYLFVNRRPITSKSLYHAVQSGYGELLPKGKFPFAIIFINIDPSLVDVNVHPTKSEVRFSDERGVHDLVYAKIKESLTSPLTIPEFGSCGPEIKTKGENTQPFQPSVSMQPISPYQEQKPLTQKSEPAESSTFTSQKIDEGKLTQKSLFAETREELTNKSQISKLESQAPSPKSQVPTLEAGRANLWQLADTYILSFLKGNLMVLDQHAAHERILYEEALRNLIKKQASSQQILFPTVSDLTPSEFHILEEHKELIQKLGFEIKHFGGRTILVTAVPTLVKNRSGEGFLKEILGQLQEEEKVEKDRVKAVAKSFACHAAIKAGERLNQEEMDNLVRQLFATEEPYSCPHGRPTIIKLSLEELNKKFGRS